MLSSSRAASCGLKTIPRVALRRSFSIGTFSTRNKFPSVKLDFERYLQDLDLTKRHVQERNAAVSEQDVDRLASLYAERKALVKTLDGLRHEQKLASSNMDRDRAIQLRQQAKETSTSLSAVESQLQDCASLLPNWTHPDAPTGGYEACEQVYASDFSTTTSESDPDLESQPPAVKPEDQDHLTVATRLGWVDFHSGQKIAGSRWPVLLKEGAILEWALTQYALHTAMQHGFQPISAPDVVRTALSDRCGFQPRDGQASQSFYVNTQEITTERSELVLAGTAEIPLAGHLSKQVHASDDMPIQLVALGRSFRAEAGARGKEHRGLYRVHQFSKAELFVACHPNDSDEWLDKLVNMQIRLLENLKLPLRVLHMSTEELGASAYQKYDIEAWMPGRQSWGELSSASNCTDYQSRRLGIQMMDADSGKKVYAHTLNATAAAIPRLIVALIENGVRYGSEEDELWLELPKCLQPFWLGPHDEGGVLDAAGNYIIHWF